MKSGTTIVLSLSAAAIFTSLIFAACSSDNDPVSKKNVATGGSTSTDAGNEVDSGAGPDASVADAG